MRPVRTTELLTPLAVPPGFEPGLPEPKSAVLPVTPRDIRPAAVVVAAGGGAGDGNRTRVPALARRCSAVELRPQDGEAARCSRPRWWAGSSGTGGAAEPVHASRVACNSVQVGTRGV